jgi:hypothetical protein
MHEMASVFSLLSVTDWKKGMISSCAGEGRGKGEKKGRQAA